MTYKTPEIYQMKMTVAEWEKVPDNPIQRETINRATRFSRPGAHLSAPALTHAKVAAAQIMVRGKKKFIKLDGHARSYLWGAGSLEAPTKVIVDVYAVANMDEVKALYLQFDNRAATETEREMLWGAYAEHGFEPNSRLFQTGSILSAMKVLAFPPKFSDVRGLTTVELVQPHIPAFKVIDKSAAIFRTHHYLPCYMMTAMMCAVTRDKATAMPFFEGMALDEGRKDRNTADGIYLARRFFDTLRENIGRQWGHSMVTTCSPLILYYYENWLAGKKLPLKDTIAATKTGLRKKMEGLPALSKWWQAEIGEYYYRKIRVKGPKVTQAQQALKL